MNIERTIIYEYNLIYIEIVIIPSILGAEFHMQKKLESIKKNKSAITTIIGLLGLVLIILSFVFENTPTVSATLLSIGTSILSTAIISYITSIYQIQESNIFETIQKWGLSGIYEHRTEINPETNELLKHTEVLEICAMGLSNFRDAQSDLVKKRISKGMSLKILTLDPNSPYLKDIDKAEKRPEGYTKQSIDQLFVWLAELKTLQTSENQIEVRTYNHYPHDFFYCMDGIVYTGPYLPKASQQTITYKFLGKSKGASYYKANFDKLWCEACKQKV